MKKKSVIMNRKNSNKRNNQKRNTSKVIRCKAQGKPVFEHEVCTLFSSRDKLINKENCKNCTNSF